jgi:hypothetical protein
MGGEAENWGGEREGLSGEYYKPAPQAEVKLAELLLAHPGLVGRASREILVSVVQHPGLRLLVGKMYDIWSRGQTPDVTALRYRINNVRLIDHAERMAERGKLEQDPEGAYAKTRDELVPRVTLTAGEDLRKGNFARIKDGKVYRAFG